MTKRRKLLIFFLMIFMAVLTCAGIAACAEENAIRDYEKMGYVIQVTYDANGGDFIGTSNVTLVDMFNPDDYDVSDDGNVYIKLVEPTDSRRPTNSGENVTVTLSGHFFCGWYQTRENVTDGEGNLLDEDGNIMDVDEDGNYTLAGTTEKAIPAYVYSDMWDFDEDRVVYSGEPVSMTLYAAWVPYFEFNYLYLDGETGEWTEYATTTFDYKTQQNNGTDTNTIYMPYWEDGAMTYRIQYKLSSSSYTFPSRSGYTFSAAYTDAAMTQKIEESFVHPGSIDYSTGTAVNSSVNIYVVFDEGEIYRISEARQFISYASLSGIYEIYDDLDFTGLTWPSTYDVGEFNGKIYAVTGENVVFSNISLTHSSSTASYGGLFGHIGPSAVIENITFENVTFYLAGSGTRNSTSGACFGMFSGYIESGAIVQNVVFRGELLYKIGHIQIYSDRNYINLLANYAGDGSSFGVTLESHIDLEIWAENTAGTYWYYINYSTVEVDGDLRVSYELFSSDTRYDTDENGNRYDDEGNPYYFDEYYIIDY